MKSGYGKFMFRGEPRWYSTHRSSLGRHVVDRNICGPHAETALLANFMTHAYHRLSPTEAGICTNVMGWWTMMQHYGAPTRLLDWTYSPWVAAYFAAEGDTDGYIWCLPDRLPQLSAEVLAQIDPVLESKRVPEFLEKRSGLPPFCWLLGTYEMTDRMVAQQCLYSIAHPIERDHMEAFGEMATDSSADVIVIKGNLKPWLRNLLPAMNVTAQTLFPGVQGVGMHMSEIMRWGLPYPSRH